MKVKASIYVDIVPKMVYSTDDGEETWKATAYMENGVFFAEVGMYRTETLAIKALKKVIRERNKA